MYKINLLNYHPAGVKKPSKLKFTLSVLGNAVGFAFFIGVLWFALFIVHMSFHGVMS